MFRLAMTVQVNARFTSARITHLASILQWLWLLSSRKKEEGTYNNVTGMRMIYSIFHYLYDINHAPIRTGSPRCTLLHLL